MQVFVIGATGYLGSAIARGLLAKGHQVSALARNAGAAKTLKDARLTPVEGTLEELPRLAATVKNYDAVVFAAKIPFATESGIVAPLLDALSESGKAFVFTSGTSCLSIETPNGEWDERSFAEDDPFEPQLWTGVRMESEKVVRAAAQRGVRAMVVRPPMIWGEGGGNGQVPWIFQGVEKTGAACYLGRGLNLYTHVHVDDLADVYALALERGAAGALYHAVAGEVNWRTIAEAVADVMGCATRSLSYKEMQDLWGETDAPYRFAVNSRSRSPRARAELGWKPVRLDLIDDIRNGSYRARFNPAPATTPR